MTFRKLLSKLNRSLDTVQIKMCNDDWDKINFSTITSRTLYKNLKTFQSKKNFKNIILIYAFCLQKGVIHMN